MTGWIIFGVIGWVVAFMIMICKGGNNDRMAYPAEKKVDSVKPLHIKVSVYHKKNEYKDSCVFELIEGEVAKSEEKSEYHFEARIVKI